MTSNCRGVQRVTLWSNQRRPSKNKRWILCTACHAHDELLSSIFATTAYLCQHRALGAPLPSAWSLQARGVGFNQPRIISGSPPRYSYIDHRGIGYWLHQTW